jgi:hypothetical protein
MKKIKLLAAAVIALGAMQAQAVTTAWATHDSVEFGDDKVKPGVFEDSFEFSLTDLSSLMATAVSNNLGQAFNINDGLVQLYRVAPGPDFLVGSFNFNGTTGSTPNSFNALTVGDYYYRVSGAATGNAGGWYSLSSTVAAVPEPHTAALMLAGLGALGLLVRRRRPRQP